MPGTGCGSQSYLLYRLFGNTGNVASHQEKNVNHKGISRLSPPDETATVTNDGEMAQALPCQRNLFLLCLSLQARFVRGVTPVRTHSVPIPGASPGLPTLDVGWTIVNTR